MSQLYLNDQIYSHNYAEVFGCSHRWTVSYEEKSFCHQCGIFCGLGVRVFKTLKLKYNTFFNPMKLMKQALNPHLPIDIKTLSPEYLQTRSVIIDFVFQVADLLHMSQNTAFLAVNYLDQYESKVEIASSDRFLFASTALMVAAKSIELDEKIPFISKLKRYSSMTSYPEIVNFRTQDFRNVELKIIQTLNWNLQQLTLNDRVEYLLSFGILDDDDSINSASQFITTSPLKDYQQDQSARQNSLQQIDIPDKKTNQRLKDLKNDQIYNIVKEIETSYRTTCIQILKDKITFEQDQVTLALACIAYLRKNIGLLNIWSQQLQTITGFSAQSISSTVSQMISIFSKSQRGSVTYSSKQSLPSSSNKYANTHHQQQLSQSTSHFLNIKNDQNTKPQSKVHQYSYLNVSENNSFISFSRELERTQSQKLESVNFSNQPQLVRISSNAFQGKLFH